MAYSIDSAFLKEEVFSPIQMNDQFGDTGQPLDTWRSCEPVMTYIPTKESTEAPSQKEDRVHSSFDDVSTNFVSNMSFANEKYNSNNNTIFDGGEDRMMGDAVENSQERKAYKERISRSLSVVMSALNGIGGSDRKLKIIHDAQNQKYRKFKSSFMGIFVGLLTAIGGFLYGYDTGIINSLLEMKYVKENFTGRGKSGFTVNEKAILTSILSLGTLVGSLISPFISDKYGRKFCMIISLLIFFTIGIILQLCSHSYGLFLAGRFVNGIGIGVISSIIPLFQAEVSPRWIRGTIISFYQWAITWGLLVSSAISQSTKNLNDPRCFRIPVALQFVWSAFLLAGLFSIPESPRFYVMKNDLDGAILSLSRYRRLTINDEELIEELIEIKASYDYETSTGSVSYLDCFRSKEGRSHQLKRILTMIALQACQQCSGINFIFYYGVNFFVATGVEDSFLMSLVTYAVNVIFTLPGILLVDKCGRRKLLIIGGIGMVISNFIVAIVGVTANSIIVNKVMLAFLCTFIACFASTWGPVVWVLTGEIFSLSIRQKAVSLSASSNWIVNFVFAFSTPYLIDQGRHTAALGTKIFFLWGSLNGAGVLVTLFFVYETKGLLLEEIDELYNNCSNAFFSAQVNKRIRKENIISNEEVIGEKENEREEEQRCEQRTRNGDRHANTSGDASLGQPDITNLENVKSGHTDSNSLNLEAFSTNDTGNSLSPMEYLNQWEQRHQRENILSDNIISRDNNAFPESFEFDSRSDDSIDGDNNNGNGTADDLHSSEMDFSFNYGLYGDNPRAASDRLAELRAGENSTGDTGAGNTELDDYGDVSQDYYTNLEDVINEVSQQSGIDLHPQSDG